MNSKYLVESRREFQIGTWVLRYFCLTDGLGRWPFHVWLYRHDGAVGIGYHWRSVADAYVEVERA